MTTARLSDTRCPNCAATVDAATATGGGRPAPVAGDVGVCIYCAVVLVYDGDPVRARLPRGPERAELYGHPEIARVRQAVLTLPGNHHRRGLQ